MSDLSEWNIAVCGLNCAKCDIYMASRGDQEKLKGVIEWFKKERELDLKPEAINCRGCRGPVESHWSPDCKFLLCAKGKGHEYCFQCTDFVCKKLEDFSRDGMAHHKRTVDNMKRIRQTGLQAWISEQAQKGESTFCP